MAYQQNEVVTYKIQVSDLIGGSWQTVYRTGQAKVLNYGFQMQLGDFGYDLEVINERDGHYNAGTTIRAYTHNVYKN